SRVLIPRRRLLARAVPRSRRWQRRQPQAGRAPCRCPWPGASALTVYSLASGDMLGVLVQQLSCEFYDRCDALVCQAVVDRAVLAARGHEPAPAQAGEVV